MRDELEAQLRSLKPRRPSAKIKLRLFPSSALHSEFTRMMRWFAPVGACAVMALVAFHHEGGFTGGAPGHRSVSLMASNQATVRYEPEVNLVPLFFEWTNRSGSALSIGSFLPGKAN